MATFKAEVYAHQKKADGTYNIKIRVTQNKRKKYLPTTYYVTKEDLTRSLKLKNQKYIDLTDQQIRKYRQICDRAGERLKDMTVEQVVELITSDNGEHFDLDIVAYARNHIKELYSTGHDGNARAYEVAINNLIKFVGREKISIHEITSRFVSDWIRWIAEQPAPHKRKKGGRAQSLYPSLLRAVHNKAKAEFNDEDMGIIRIPYTPFKKVKLPKIPVSRKRALDIEHIRMIADLPYMEIMQPGKNRFNLAKDVFLLSFALVGMNAVDLYNCTDCKNGRITYHRTKTKNRRADGAEISIKIEPEIEALVNKYKDPDGKRVFGFYHWYSRMDSFNCALNYGLKKVGKAVGVDDLEFYAARHSWATIANNDAGVDKYTVHTSLNHVDDDMKVTDIYIKRSWDEIDNANRKVLDTVKLHIATVDEPIYLPKQKRNLPKQNFTND